MAKPQKDLGRLEAVYGIAPAYLQRAVFMAVLSFMFFLAMMFAFYIRQSMLFFLLSTAFLIVYLLTMFSWVMQRKAGVEVYEAGFRYRKNSVLWSEIAGVGPAGEVLLKDKKAIAIPQTIAGFDKVVELIRYRSAKFL